MKAKLQKQHNKSLDYMESEDSWGNKVYIVEGEQYFTKETAKLAINKLITDEFNARYVPKKEKK